MRARLLFASLLAHLVSLAFATNASAVAPSIDPTFANGHPATQPFLGLGGMVDKLLIQRDGKIVASGSYVYRFSGMSQFPTSRGAIVRYRPDGSVDPTFGVDGIVAAPAASPALLLRNGQFVGTTEHGVARFHGDYSPDPSMATNGAESIAWYGGYGDVLEQRDGKIVVATSVGSGTALLTLVRFNTDGTLDTTFNHVGALIAPRGPSTNDDFAGAVLQPDGKIVVAATSTVGGVLVASILRFLPDGTPDPAFGTGGRAVIPNTTASIGDVRAYALALQPSGRLLVASVQREGLPDQTHPVTMVVAAVSPSGTMDPTFGSGGRYIHRSPIEDPRMLVHPDGKVVVLFTSTADPTATRYVLLRLTADGRPDPTFGSDGLWSPGELSTVRAMALQADGQLVLAGDVWVGVRRGGGDFAVARYSIGASPAIEYYNAALDHHFVTPNPMEAAELDAGVHAGWTRTGREFAVFGAAAAAPSDFVPVCRFYLPPARGDSHFFTASAQECADVQAKASVDPNYTGYLLETPSAFFVALPDTATGTCPDATVPVYRLWNRRTDSNHRYVTDPVLATQMVARGYVAEGYGPDAVAMCAVQ